MGKLFDFIKINKESCYKMAENNTTRNKNGKPVIKKDDEWLMEREWDFMFIEMKGE